ncbi:hypothetical protein SAMN05444671_2765 [Flavobacterium sp. CF108]|uniref:hypothetical protein n=1 Tax=unclassified Flavobacterium TaxID=196869 RepID=UPI0008B2CF00|nr:MULTISPECIES: hypothetical protein [unclassified Flavobacterium]SEO01676.1 hypothetical protein SAMN04487978_2080 [Flavobacterium sp. fv08]SHH36660.1 hypothetical protein SAMN05444671_2765 [Flavobacterium sp. CF108]
MPHNKAIHQSVHIDPPVTKRKWKISKILAISFFLALGVFFIVWNSSQINLEGDWTPTKIVIDGDDILSSDPLSKHLSMANQVTIIRGQNQIQVSVGEKDIIASYIIKKNDLGKDYIEFTSKEKALNGDFEMKIDTIDSGPQQYIVEVKLHSKKTYLIFQKNVIVPPWKPEPPRRGQV